MMHADIEKDEIVERYVRGQLSPEEQRRFEDHFFGCDECFEKLQEVERFNAALRDAAARGLLDHPLSATGAGPGNWLRWGFALTSCATAALIVFAGWVHLHEIPALRLERDRQAAQLQHERQARTPPVQAATAAEPPEANVALVMLQASRAGDRPASTILPAGARRLVLWIETGPSRFRSFRLDLLTLDKGPLVTVNHLQRNQYGALSASIPADTLPAGTLRITLSGLDPPPAALVGEYQLTIDRR